MPRMPRLALPVLLLTSLNAAAIDFHGYFRAGVGSNSEGGDQTCFQLPGAASKYRLGNECESYGALKFGEQLFKGEDGSHFRANATFAFASAQDRDWEAYDTAMREVYVEGGGLGDGAWRQARLWVGKRLLRQDVHLTDFFYWDNSGAGGGFSDLPVGSGKLSYSLVRNVRDPIANLNSGSDRATTTHDLRLREIDSNADGQLTVGLAWIHSDESQAGLAGEDGWQLHLEHTQKPLLGGWNRITLQYGAGAGASLGKNPDDTAAASDNTLRLVEQLLFQPSDNWSGQATFVHEIRDGIQSWTSIGARPIYHFSDHFSLAVELGLDQVDPNVGPSMNLTKLTIAPQLSAGRGCFSRPALRAFVTFADWNNAARDAAVNPVAGGAAGVFGNATSAWTLGLQAEAWW